MARVRRLLGVKRVGHTGTLDPQARGLLILLIGSATKTQEQFLAMPKQYRLRGEFGRQTSTGDSQGEIRVQKPYSQVTVEMLQDALKAFEGDIEQLPPMYSALKYKGKPYYEYARKGLEIPRVPRTLRIDSFEFISYTAPFWEARVRCSRGTYVRTLVEDVAIRLGTVGTLSELVREKIGDYGVQEAVAWSVIEEGNVLRLKQAVHPWTSPSVLIGGSPP